MSMQQGDRLICGSDWLPPVDPAIFKKPAPVTAKPSALKTNKNAGALPSYPQANKQVYKDLRKLRLMEKKNPDMYQLPPDLQKALDLEADTLCDLFMGECENPEEGEEKICERITDIVADDFRKAIRLQVTKRLLDVKTGLTVRINVSGKLKKQHLVYFLANYEVESLKKSDRKMNLYMAHCSTFESFDALCSLRETSIDDVRVTFKPLQILGPPSRVSRKSEMERRKMNIRSQIDNTGSNLLEPSDELENVEDEDLFVVDTKGDAPAECDDVTIGDDKQLVLDEDDGEETSNAEDVLEETNGISDNAEFEAKASEIESEETNEVNEPIDLIDDEDEENNEQNQYEDEENNEQNQDDIPDIDDADVDDDDLEDY